MFTIELRGLRLYHICYETKDVKLPVAEISRGRDWELHYGAHTHHLKKGAKDKLTAYGLEQITRIKITERLVA